MARVLEQKNIELEKTNKELESFNYISSHDLQEPLRKIQIISNRIHKTEHQNLSDVGRDYFKRMELAAKRMQKLIRDLLTYSRTNSADQEFENTDLNIIVEQVKTELKETIEEKHATIEVGEMCHTNIIPFQFLQLMHNLIGNALKFSKPDIPPHIIIKSEIVKETSLNTFGDGAACHIRITDNGIGFEPQYRDRIFEVFQRLHNKEKIAGTGIGLAIVKKIVENHSGIITATSELNIGATFDIYIPANLKNNQYAKWPPQMILADGEVIFNLKRYGFRWIAYLPEIKVKWRHINLPLPHGIRQPDWIQIITWG